MKKARALVLTGFGLNCDLETAFAFEEAGALADRVHINALVDGSVHLSDYQILAFGGGFSWGDDHGAGVVQAVRMKTRLGNQILEFVRSDKLVIGICNGFQTLVNLGLLPGFDNDYQRRSVALTFNDCGNFRDDWVHLLVDSDSPCVFLRGIEALDMPVRHGEGKFVAEDGCLERLENGKQIVLRYGTQDGKEARMGFPANPNGSLRDIAGICDPTGRVFGLMPHPEAFHHWTNHPHWTRMADERRRRGEAPFPDEPTPGMQVFLNAVDYFRR